MLARRDSKSPTELDMLSARIAERVRGLAEMVEAGTISTYIDTGSEVRTMSIVKSCLAEGKVVIVPVTDRVNRKLIFSELRDPAKELEPRTFGILEPKAECLRPVSLEQAQVVLVPGVAWDRNGNRVGYGGGFYDRTINSLKGYHVKIVLSYEFQIVNKIPTTAYDKPVEKIVTENEVITASRNR